MKRLIVVLCVVGFITALPLSHSATADPPRRYALCHITNVEVLGPGVALQEGRVIEVPANAVAVHETHGDFKVKEPIGGLRPGTYCARELYLPLPPKPPGL